MAGVIKLGYENQIPYYYFDAQVICIPPDPAVGVVTGTERFIENNGLTVGCWIKPDFLPTITADNSTLIGKITLPANSGAGQYAYVLDLFSPGIIRFWVSSTGGYSNSYVDTIQSSGGITANEWNFVVGRWSTTDIAVFVNGIKYSTSTTEIVNSNAPLAFGGWGNGDYKYEGYMAYPFICANPLTDAQVSNIWNKTREFFGK